MNHHTSTVKQFISTAEWEDSKMKAQEFTEIQTERLDLKPLSATFDFANHLFDIISHNRDFFRFILLAIIEKPEQEFDWLRSTESNWKNKKSATYGLFLRDTNEFVGVCSVFDISWSKESAEIGYWLNPEFAKQGFITEAVESVTKEFFNMGFKRLVIKACPENISSCAVAEKCGFVKEGILRSYDFLPALNKRVDAVIYAKIKED